MSFQDLWKIARPFFVHDPRGTRSDGIPTIGLDFSGLGFPGAVLRKAYRHPQVTGDGEAEAQEYFEHETEAQQAMREMMMKVGLTA